MALDHHDFNTVSDSPTYKGELDETCNLLRQPQDSQTTSGGTDGQDYEIDAWAPLTLTDGLIYPFRPHLDNIGACHIDHGGSAYDIKLSDGSDPRVGQLEQGRFHQLLFDSGAGEFQLINPVAIDPSYVSGVSTGADSWTRLARITLNAQDDAANLHLHSWLADPSADDNTYEADLFLGLRQAAALTSPPDNTFATRLTLDPAAAATVLRHNSFRLHHQEINATHSVVDVYYSRASSGSTALGFRPVSSRLRGSASIEYFNAVAPDTEANICAGTGGSFDGTSRAMRGESVTGTLNFGSTASETNTSVETITHNLGTDHVMVDLMMNNSLEEWGWSAACKVGGRRATRVFAGGPEAWSDSLEILNMNPATGEVSFVARNEYSISATLTGYYRITALD